MTKQTAVEFITTDFVTAHGRRPAGRGGWAFGLVRHPNDAETLWYTGLYSEAKKQAPHRARQLAAGCASDYTIDLWVLS